ncbi:MAG TPA: alpha/beta hydrolase [Xanthomonadaceae bacterium]|nr:alpha/beta hydrolase [Xanthomonadaceae bacterium]
MRWGSGLALLVGVALGALFCAVWLAQRSAALADFEPEPPRDIAPGVHLVEGDCWFNGGWLRRERCAWFYPSVRGSAEVHALPVVALQRRLFGRSSERATVFLTGGPGGNNYLYQEGIEYWREWIARLDLDHDLVLYDPRGSGASWPRLACPELEPLARSLLHAPLDRELRWAVYEPVLLACIEQVPEADRVAGLYSTRNAGRDLRELVQALRREFGYREISVYGVSYGTRLALEALADAPDLVDAVVLDSPYPPGVDLVLGFADTFAAILARLQEKGVALREPLDRALQAVAAAPPVVEVEDPWSEAPQRVRVDAEMLMALVEHALFANQDLVELAGLLEAAADGTIDDAWHPLLADWLWSSMDPDFGVLAFLLIECRDNPAMRREDEEAVLDRHPAWREALQSPERMFSFCERAGVTPAPLVPRSLAQPTLVLAADLDPRTPADVALESLKTLPRATVMRLPIAGHGVADIDDCAARAVGAFLNSGGQASLPDCAEGALVSPN